MVVKVYCTVSWTMAPISILAGAVQLHTHQAKMALSIKLFGPVYMAPIDHLTVLLYIYVLSSDVNDLYFFI
jgi:hypothetical protein